MRRPFGAVCYKRSRLFHRVARRNCPRAAGSLQEDGELSKPQPGHTCAPTAMFSRSHSAITCSSNATSVRSTYEMHDTGHSSTAALCCESRAKRQPKATPVLMEERTNGVPSWMASFASAHWVATLARPWSSSMKKVAGATCEHLPHPMHTVSSTNTASRSSSLPWNTRVNCNNKSEPMQQLESHRPARDGRAVEGVRRAAAPLMQRRIIRALLAPMRVRVVKFYRTETRTRKFGSHSVAHAMLRNSDKSCAS